MYYEYYDLQNMHKLDCFLLYFWFTKQSTESCNVYYTRNIKNGTNFAN
jgi:hypothetical protein